MVKIGKRISIMFICVLLIFGSAKRAEAAAEAGALSIIGGSVAAGGIGAAIAAIAPPALIILGVALAAQGIYVNVTEESERLGMTKIDYIGTKLAEFALASGKQYSDVCHDIVDESTIYPDGKIGLSTSATLTISKFISNLIVNQDFLEVSQVDNVLKVGNASLPVVKYGDIIHVITESDGDKLGIKNESSTQTDYAFCAVRNGVLSQEGIYIISKEYRIRYSLYLNGSLSVGSHSYYSNSRNGIYYYKCSALQSTDTPYVPILDNFPAVLDSLNGEFNVESGTLSADGLVNGNNITDASAFNPNAGDVVVLDPGLDIPSIENEYGKSGTISIDNYLEALTRAMNGVEANTITISNALTGVLDTVAVGTYDPVGTATVAQEAEEDLPRVMTPVVDLTLNPAGSAAEKDLEGLAFDLTAIFPFCIPFDIFALIEKFDVQPETPRILVSLPLPGVGETLDLDLDLAPFETVAVILRSMELIAFIVGLALVTRNLIRG